MCHAREPDASLDAPPGSSGYVYEVKDRKGGQRFALKQVILADDEEKLLMCERELDIMVRTRTTCGRRHAADNVQRIARRRRAEYSIQYAACTRPETTNAKHATSR
jgi:hypothetical protein